MSKLTKDLRSLSKEELTNKVAELRKQLVEQKRARSANELANIQAIKKTRRSIAVALTLLAEADEKKEEAK